VRKNTNGGEQSRRDAPQKPYHPSPGVGSQWGFEGQISRTAMYAVAGMGKTRGQRSKRNFARETEGTHRSISGRSTGIAWERSHRLNRTATCRRQGYAASMHTHTRHVSNSVGAPSKNLVFLEF
jgi:hypothetical protein